MKRILLACSSGMSTSLLVSKMKEVADQRGLEVEIWAVGNERVDTEMEKADVVFIGPQMRFLKRKLDKKANKIGIQIEVIDPVAYGRMDGEAVLNRALELIN
ncbi:PTS sugar transporter subunit IIB [Garciella nitratireducens]|uniref:PTS system, cellobiose-specific IIB component n=1 Tax=Garciella nitratireducens DSM 15102 TaxID=1121911 RepID=A0A1T4N3A0_9FIRM|nr:PTS sugar transporter subunit IIB [Garciella nitratireducens]RBP42693.1 PTS system cellobiose-specific IIB component [Garciella nitratireducens]SJZ73614.1 PTS system, cellobiose-specific IIB component [Garciella nitratireducens DSM 15102]